MQPTLRDNAEKDGRGFRGDTPITLFPAAPTTKSTPCGRGVSCHGFAHPLRAAAALPAAHLRATHSPDDIRLGIGNDTRTLRHCDLSAYRHIDTSPSPYPKRGAAADNSAPAAVAVADARPSCHSASIENLHSSNNPLFHRGSYGRAFRLGCIAPPVIIAPLPRPPPLCAMPPPPRLPLHHPDVLPGYVNDAAESGPARTSKECGAATHTTALSPLALCSAKPPLFTFGVSAVRPCHVPPGHNRQSTNSATSSGHHRPSADVGIGVCRDLKLPCVQFDYRVNGITALSARWGKWGRRLHIPLRKAEASRKKRQAVGG